MSNHPGCPCNECRITRDRDKLNGYLVDLRAALWRLIGDDIGCISPPPSCPPGWPGYGAFHCGWCQAKAALEKTA